MHAYAIHMYKVNKAIKLKQGTSSLTDWHWKVIVAATSLTLAKNMAKLQILPVDGFQHVSTTMVYMFQVYIRRV